MLKFVVPAAAAVCLVFLAARSEAVGPDAPQAGMGWHLSHEGSMAKLAYGVANSDQLAVMMTCEPGQSQAAVYGEAAPVEARLVRASLDTPIDPLSGGLAEESRIGLDGAAMRGLIRSGRIAVESGDGAGRLTATRDERRLIADFVSYCVRTSV